MLGTSGCPPVSLALLGLLLPAPEFLTLPCSLLLSLALLLSRCRQLLQLPLHQRPIMRVAEPQTLGEESKGEVKSPRAPHLANPSPGFSVPQVYSRWRSASPQPPPPRLADGSGPSGQKFGMGVAGRDEGKRCRVPGPLPLPHPNPWLPSLHLGFQPWNNPAWFREPRDGKRVCQRSHSPSIAEAPSCSKDFWGTLLTTASPSNSADGAKQARNLQNRDQSTTSDTLPPSLYLPPTTTSLQDF